MQKFIFQYGRLAKKEAESALAPMAEFRSYAIAMLAETTGYMDRGDEDSRLDEPERESVQNQQACLIAFIQGADCTERLILEAQYLKTYFRDTTLAKLPLAISRFCRRQM